MFELSFYFLKYFQIVKSQYPTPMMLCWLVTLINCFPALLACDPSDGDMPWKPEKIALFELVDEINATFYEDISRNATTKENKYN